MYYEYVHQTLRNKYRLINTSNFGKNIIKNNNMTIVQIKSQSYS